MKFVDDDDDDDDLFRHMVFVHTHTKLIDTLLTEFISELVFYAFVSVMFQGESIEKLTVKQSKLRVLDLGSNRFKTLPKALLKNSPHLNALYLDNNRLLNCSQIHVLRRASVLEFVDLSENRLVRFEKDCFDVLVAGVTIRLAGNPFQCSCETAIVVQWLNADGRRTLDVADGDSVTCSGPPELSGTHILRSDGSSRLPGSLECHWRADVIVAVIILGGLTVVVIILVRARRRFMLLRLCRRTISSSSGQNGSISSVTISNSCYGNGSASGASNVGGASAPGSGESTTRYSPLIEDDLHQQQVPGEPASAARKEASTAADVVPCSLVTANGVGQRKQPANTGGGDQAATSCGEIDNEALLPYHVTEMEEAV